MNKPRLIDANELKKHITSYVGMWEDGEFYVEIEAVLRGIDSQPTAYDIDKIKEMEDEIEELKVITGLMQKRTYYRKFVDEIWKKQMGNELSEPDFDFIYKLYFEMIEQRNKVVEQLEEFYRENECEMNNGFIEVCIDIVKGGVE